MVPLVPWSVAEAVSSIHYPRQHIVSLHAPNAAASPRLGGHQQAVSLHAPSQRRHRRVSVVVSMQ